MKHGLIWALTLFISLLGYCQDITDPYVYQKAKELITAKPYYETYLSAIADNGDLVYAEREVLPFNYGINPIRLDSLAFHVLRNNFIADSNLVFVEERISDFDNDYCYECDSIINVDYDYARVNYRTGYGYAADEDRVKEERFIYYYVGSFKSGLHRTVHYVHVLKGANREF